MDIVRSKKHKSHVDHRIGIPRFVNSSTRRVTFAEHPANEHWEPFEAFESRDPTIASDSPRRLSGTVNIVREGTGGCAEITGGPTPATAAIAAGDGAGNDIQSPSGDKPEGGAAAKG